MTLSKQLILAVLAALVLLYFGTLAVSFGNARLLVEEQMQVHAQDGATSIALSMTQAAAGEDKATLETLLNAVSDSGFYQRIYFQDMAGNQTLERVFSVSIDGVPAWFVNAVEIPNYQGVAEVSSGWVRLGTLHVVSHPGQAYQHLWQVLVRQLVWFSLMGGFVCIAAFFAIRKLLRPLSEVELQANAICNQEFVIQESIPRTRELKVVVQAMNRLAERLKGLFANQAELIQDLRFKSHTDEVTGLSNRADFDGRLNTFTRDESGSHSGSLMIFALQNLSRINALAGREEGNEVLRTLGQCLRRCVGHHELALVARRQGQEFAVFVPDIAADVADSLAASLLLEASRISWRHQETEQLSLLMGFTYAAEITNGPELLSEADMALHSIDQSSAQTWAKFTAEQEISAPVVSRSVVDWKTFVERVLENKAITLRAQQAVSVPDKVALNLEIYARFLADDNNELAAGTVMPMVERFGHAATFDKLVLTTLAESVNERPDLVAVNICPGSISSPSFQGWLVEFLAAHQTLAERLVFEVSEHGLKLAGQDIKVFQDILSRYNAGLAIDHFGLESSAFGYLASLPLRYLKVHRSFIKNIHLSHDNQFYVKALAQLAQTREIRLVVEGVENEAEWQVLSKMNIDGAQGYYFGHPQPLK